MDVATPYLRGELSENEVPALVQIQLTFSAGAGMADSRQRSRPLGGDLVSRGGDELASQHFLPFGFTRDRVDTIGFAKLFVPLGRLGYARFHGDAAAGPADPEDRNFELDASALESWTSGLLTREWPVLDRR